MRTFVRYSLIAIALLLLAALFIGPRLIDHEALRIALTEQLSTALGRPVEIGRLDVRILPQPSVTLERFDTTLGDQADDALHIGRVRATLSPYALLERQVRFTRVDIDMLALNPRLIDSLRQTATALNKGTSGGRVDIRLQQAHISGLTWTTADGLRLGPFTATLDWEDSKLPARIALAQDDGQLQAQVTFADGSIVMRVQADDWTTPVPAPLRKALQITRLDANARYTEGRLDILDAGLAGPLGRLHLNGQLAWQDDWRFDGRLAGEQVDLPLLLASFGIAPVPGKASGECALKLHGLDAAQMFQKPGLDCDLSHTHTGKVAQLELTTQTEADALGYTLHAQHLTLPVGPALHFDTLDLRGMLTEGQLSFTTAKATGYEGEVNMQGALSWKSGWRWNLTAQSRKLRLDPLLAVFDQHNLDGRLDADCQGRLAGTTFTALFQRPGLNCAFTLTEGILRNTDLEQAARLIRIESKTAGNTPFDHLSGRLHMQDGQTQFTDLKLRSTALEAKGGVSIDRDKRLSGELSAGLKNTGGMVSVPLVVSGVVGDPVIRPTKSAMAGGAAGTVLLGPGVGTAVGVKVGEALSKMTGWLRPKPKSAATDSPVAE